MTHDSNVASDVESVSTNIDFTYKSWIEHAVGVCSRPIELWVVFVTSLGFIWLVAETAIQFVAADPRGWYLYALLVLASFLAALVVGVVSYRARCPIGFEKRSRRAIALAHLQPKRWETRLAQVLIAELVIPIDREYQDLLKGNQFVVASRHDSYPAFHRWSEDRSKNLLRMLHVSKRLLTTELSQSLGSKSSPDKKAIEILGWVESVARLYRETVRFERQHHAVLVPSEAIRLHSMLADWSETVRDAIRQCLEMLEKMTAADFDSDEALGLEIVYKPPGNADEVVAELERLVSFREELARDW